MSLGDPLFGRVYNISGLVAEYIVAISVTRVPFPADASSEAGEAGARSHRANRWAESVITVSPQGHFGEAGGGPEASTLLGSPVPCMRRRTPASRLFVVVPATLRDPLMV